MRYMIRIAYDGKRFYGSQKQLDKKTIQGQFEKALSNIYCKDIKVKICSRLDRGVSALDFTLTYDTIEDNRDIDRVKRYLSKWFKDDVLIKSIQRVDDDFSCRHDPLSKTYCYIIDNNKFFNPLLNDIAYRGDNRLDVEYMKKCSKAFIRRGDFRAFSSPEDGESTIIQIDDISIESKDEIIYIRVTAKAFLRYEVRFIVGTLLQCGLHQADEEEITALLNSKEVKHKRLKAKGEALYLEKIRYKDIPEEENCFSSISFKRE